MKGIFLPRKTINTIHRQFKWILMFYVDDCFVPYHHNLSSNHQHTPVISWLISVIVDARSQLEYARRDKSEGDDGDVSKER